MEPSIFDWERRDYRQKEGFFTEDQIDLLWLIGGMFVFSLLLNIAVNSV